MHLEALFDHDDDDAPDDDDDDDDGCDDDVGGGDAKTRDLKVDLILCILCSSEILFYTSTFCAPVKYLPKQKTSKPDFFICGQEEKLNNILCSCLCCIGQLRYLQNRN